MFMHIKWYVLILLVLFVSCSDKKNVKEEAGTGTLDTYVLVVSFDGFRWDYPDHHGIISNNFYASELGGIYRIGDSEMVTNPDAYFGEPLWVTAEKQGIKSASYFWVGRETSIMGVSPSYLVYL